MRLRQCRKIPGDGLQPVSAANEECSFTAVSLDTLTENGNVFRTAEVSVRTNVVDPGNGLSNFDQHVGEFFVVGEINGSAHLRNFIRNVKALAMPSTMFLTFSTM